MKKLLFLLLVSVANNYGAQDDFTCGPCYAYLNFLADNNLQTKEMDKATKADCKKNAGLLAIIAMLDTTQPTYALAAHSAFLQIDDEVRSGARTNNLKEAAQAVYEIRKNIAKQHEEKVIAAFNEERERIRQAGADLEERIARLEK